MSGTIDLSDKQQRRRLIVDLLRSEIITNVRDLTKHIEQRTGQKPPTIDTLGRDLLDIGAIKVNLGGNYWRYRTPDLITNDDLRLAIQDRLQADGMGAKLWTEGVIIQTTRGTAASLGTLFKMLREYDLDDSIQWVMHDGDDTVMLAVAPATARKAYCDTFNEWCKPS